MIDIKIQNDSNLRKLSKRKKIKLSQERSKLKNRVHINLTNCLVCGCKCNRFCQSHSIPKFILKGMTKTGRLLTGKDFQKSSFGKASGISNALIFSCICEKCDNTFFQEYENPDSFNHSVTNLIINEIALKIYLKHLYKRLCECEEWMVAKQDNSKKRFPDPMLDAIAENKLLTSRLDIDSAMHEIDRLIKHKNEKIFYVIDEIDLDYQTQMAYQGFIAISQGFDGVVNDIYNYDPKYKMELLFLCIFPLCGKTKIVLFCEDGSIRLRRFYKYYKKQDLKTKLYIINYLILLYDEEWCVDSSFDKNILNNETKWLINQRTDALFESDNLEELINEEKDIRDREVAKTHKIQTSGNIYNFLDKQHNSKD